MAPLLIPAAATILTQIAEASLAIGIVNEAYSLVKDLTKTKSGYPRDMKKDYSIEAKKIERLKKSGYSFDMGKYRKNIATYKSEMKKMQKKYKAKENIKEDVSNAVGQATMVGDPVSAAFSTAFGVFTNITEGVSAQSYIEKEKKLGIIRDKELYQTLGELNKEQRVKRFGTMFDPNRTHPPKRNFKEDIADICQSINLAIGKGKAMISSTWNKTKSAGDISWNLGNSLGSWLFDKANKVGSTAFNMGNDAGAAFSENKNTNFSIWNIGKTAALSVKSIGNNKINSLFDKSANNKKSRNSNKKSENIFKTAEGIINNINYVLGNNKTKEKTFKKGKEKKRSEQNFRSSKRLIPSIFRYIGKDFKNKYGQRRKRKIGRNWQGTKQWQGGYTYLHEKGGEIFDLPGGTRIYPQDFSVKGAYKDGARVNKGNGRTFNIDKLSDTLIVRERADVDKIAKGLADKLNAARFNVA